jgi:hypothetical protein
LSWHIPQNRLCVCGRSQAAKPDMQGSRLRKKQHRTALDEDEIAARSTPEAQRITCLCRRAPKVCTYVGQRPKLKRRPSASRRRQFAGRYCSNAVITGHKIASQVFHLARIRAIQGRHWLVLGSLGVWSAVCMYEAKLLCHTTSEGCFFSSRNSAPLICDGVWSGKFPVRF